MRYRSVEAVLATCFAVTCLVFGAQGTTFAQEGPAALLIQQGMTFYIGGDVERPGAYPLVAGQSTLEDAAKMAGLVDPNADYSVQITHRVNGKLEVSTIYSSLKELRAIQFSVEPLMSGDQIHFRKRS